MKKKMEKENIHNSGAENKGVKEETAKEDAVSSEKEVKTAEVSAETGKPKPEAEKQIEEMQKKVLDLQEKLKITEEKLLRSHAEFENFRKRTIKEKSDIRKNSQLDTLSAILPVLDHFELALSAAEDSNNVHAVLDGMKLIKAEFAKTLDSLGVDTINAVGEAFNPEIHEAIANEPSDEYEKDIVAKQWRAGYKLGDRLIRPASVVVSTGRNTEEG